jgi:hypothetical protein
MDLLHQFFNNNKDLWFERMIGGYKGPVYYRMIRIDKTNTEIRLERFYPQTRKWQYDSIMKIEYLAKLEIVVDEEIIGYLNAELAKLLLIKKDNI